MAWTIEYSGPALKALGKLDARTSDRILRYMREHVAHLDTPRGVGQALKGSLIGHWRYRVGDYRIICEIHDGRLTVVVVAIGDRKDVYRR